VKYTGLLLYSDVYAAADSIIPLRNAGAKALEIMDRASCARSRISGDTVLDQNASRPEPRAAGPNSNLPKKHSFRVGSAGPRCG